MEFHGEVSLVV